MTDWCLIHPFRLMAIHPSNQITLFIHGFLISYKWPFPSCFEPHNESEARWKVFHIKISFVYIWMKTNFHMKSFALNLSFIKRLKATRKWPIQRYIITYPINQNTIYKVSYNVTYSYLKLQTKLKRTKTIYIGRVFFWLFLLISNFKKRNFFIIEGGKKLKRAVRVRHIWKFTTHRATEWHFPPHYDNDNSFIEHARIHELIYK